MSEDTESSELDGVAALIGLALAVPFIIWEAFVIVRLWAWFVVPLGVPAVGMWHAAGFSILVGLMTSHATGNKSPGAILIRLVFAPGIALVFGAIARSLM